MRRNVSVLVILLLVGIMTFVMLRAGGPKSGEIKDEAMLANRGVSSFPAADEDYFVAMDNGAKRALIPVENKRSFLDVSGDIVERVDPIFYGEPLAAALKALGAE